jgi:hypothetical protein
MDFSWLIKNSWVVKEALSSSRFTCINVGDDAYIPDLLYVLV